MKAIDHPRRLKQEQLLNQLSSFVKNGQVDQLISLISENREMLCFEDVVRGIDVGIDELSRLWYDQYDWNGRSRTKATISYRDFEKAWTAYEAAHHLLTRKGWFSPRDADAKPLNVATGTLGNIHKAILRIDLHLRLRGWRTSFIGYSLSPDDVLLHAKENDVFVLSIMAHDSKIKALNLLKSLSQEIFTPLIVGGSAFKAIEAWILGKTPHRPFFAREHPEVNNFRDIRKLVSSMFNGALYIESIEELDTTLEKIAHSTL